MKVRIEADKCCGFASCISLADTVFEIREDNIAHVKDEEPDVNLWEAVRTAAESCPTDAIVIDA